MSQQESQAQDWKAHQLCLHCTGGESDDVNPMVICDCCGAVGAHLACLATAGAPITKEQLNSAHFEWFCSTDCQGVAQGLVDAANQRRPVGKDGLFTAELVRYSEHYRASHSVVGKVISMFHSAFGTSRYADGSDLVDLVCRGAPPPEDENEGQEDDDDEPTPPDCSNFRVFVLRKRGNVVSAAAVRVHGRLMVEVPFVATRPDYRREGNARRLVTAMEDLLRELNVAWVALPAVEATVPVWTQSLGFHEAGELAAEHLEERIIVPADTRILLKKVPSAAAAAAAADAAASAAGPKRVRFSLPSTAFDGLSDSDEDDQGSGGSKRSKKKGRGGRGQAYEEEEYTGAGSDEEGDDDEEAFAELLQEMEEGEEGAAEAMQALAGGSRGGSAAQVCYNCSADDAKKYSKHEESGKWECETCKRYRKSHNGELRPERLFRRKRSAPAAAKAAAGPAGSHNAVATPARAANGNGRLTAAAPRMPQGGAKQPAAAALRVHALLGAQSTAVLQMTSTLRGSFGMMRNIAATQNQTNLSRGVAQAAAGMVRAGAAAAVEAAEGLRHRAQAAEAERARAEAAAAHEREAALRERQAREDAESRVQTLLQQLRDLEAKQNEAAAGTPLPPPPPSALTPLPQPSLGPPSAAAGELDCIIENLEGVQISPAAPERAATAAAASPARSPSLAPSLPFETCISVERSQELKKRSASLSSARQHASSQGNAAPAPGPAPATAAVGLFSVFRGASADGSGDTIVEDNSRLGSAGKEGKAGDGAALPGTQGPRSGESRAL